jgi:pimeloyl-ACP methyl ester carboxylesterase
MTRLLAGRIPSGELGRLRASDGADRRSRDQCQLRRFRPAVLLLHGFPETKLMWRKIALQLAEQFFVVAAELRGYGDSSTSLSTSDHLPYSKRAMANDMIQVMAHLGHDRFVVAGHPDILRLWPGDA